MISCGVGCLFGAFPVINVIACVLDFIMFNRLSRNDRSGTYSTMQMASIFDIITILTGNIFSMVIGIVGLVMLNNEEVKQDMKSKGIY